MPKLKPETRAARREHILDTAERCLAQHGFHRTTMQDICKAADVSPGALYIYFTSKEALIQGLCERDRLEFSEKLQRLGSAPDILGALDAIARDYFIEAPAHKRLFTVEMCVEATRNEQIAAICRPVDQFVKDSFEALFQRLKDEKRIAPALEIGTLTQVFMIMGDGLFWRRAVDPDFDARLALPGMLHTLEGLLNPVPAAELEKQSELANPNMNTARKQSAPRSRNKHEVAS